MSDLLGNQNLANMKVVFYKDIGVRNKRPVITQPVTSEVSGKRVLVVDDVSDSGHSLRVVSRHLRRKGARDVRVCTLYFKPHSISIPNYYARKTTKWVIFPWERLEAVRLIAKKAGSNRGGAAVVKKLKGSGLSSRLIKQLLCERCQHGLTVILSTHQLAIVEDVAHRIAILAQGHLLAVGRLEELKAQHGGSHLEELFFKLTTPAYPA